jgi:FkbM family methyltransferase
MWKQRVLEEVAKWSRRAPAFRGKTRLQRLAQRVLGGAEVDVEVGGVRWRLDPGELIQFRLLWDGAHDGHVLAWMLSELRPWDVVWDVGANIGDMALYCAARAGARVEAFEPSPAVFARLAENVGLNPGLAVEPHALGLSDHDGVVRFYASAERGNAGVGSLGRAANTVDEGVEVRITRGDSLIAGGWAVPRIVKMDIEGFEPEALAGMSELLKTGRTLVCVESSGYRLRERGRPLDALVSVLELLDFRVTALKDGREREVRTADLVGNVDLVGRPR